MMEANAFLTRFRGFLAGCRRCWIVVVPLFVLDALGGSVLAKKTTFQALPELDARISRAYDVARYPAFDQVMAVGQAVDAAGVYRPVIWESLEGEFILEVLPFLDPNGISCVMGIDPTPFAPCPNTRVVVGASQDDTLVPRAILWESPEPGGPWNMTVLPGPNGRAFAGGAEATSVGHPPNAGRNVTTCSQPNVFGWAENIDGTPKAVMWHIGESGVYEAHQLPDLELNNPSRATDFMYDAVGRIVVVGSAVNERAEQRPVFWLEDEVGGFGSPTELTLCPGCTAGEVTAVSHSPDPTNEWLLAGSGWDPDGNWQATLWHTDDNGETHTPHVLGVPAGFVSSAGHAAFMNEHHLAFGQAFNTTEEAWLWSVNEETTDEPLRASVVNLPANVTLRSATAIGPFERIVGLYTINGRGGRGGDTDPHAFVLTPIEEGIPTVSEWGIAVMMVLALSAGALVFGRTGGTVKQ